MRGGAGISPKPKGFQFEIHNRNWLVAEFANLLRDHNIALVLQDRSWMPSPAELKFDPITADWIYIRWLGDRKQIEGQTTTWDKTVTALVNSAVGSIFAIRSGKAWYGEKVAGNVEYLAAGKYEYNPNIDWFFSDKDIRSPPSPLARGLLAAAGLDRTSRPLHHCGLVVVRYIRQSL